MINCPNSDPPGGEYVKLQEVSSSTLNGVDGTLLLLQGATNLKGKENFFQQHSQSRASLYRNKAQKVRLNPLQPLRNPYRMSEHDQMPIRVIPFSPMVKNSPSSELCVDLFSIQKLSSPSLTTDKKKRSNKKGPRATSTIETSSNIHPLKLFGTDTSALRNENVQDLQLKSCNRASSLDDLLLASSKQPGCITRNALKRAKEQHAFLVTSKASHMTKNSPKHEQQSKTLKPNDSTSSLSSNDGSVAQLSQTLTRNNLRSSKSRKSRQKFNFGIFSRNSKCRSEYVLSEPSIFGENPNFSEKTKRDENSNESGGKEAGRSFVRKRRLSSIRYKFAKTFGTKESTSDESKLDASPKTKKRRVVGDLLCKSDEMERNNNQSFSLRLVLDDRKLREEFHQFLIKEHSDENLDFWMMCEKYKTSNDRANLAAIMHRQFLKQHAPREVNLSAKAKRSIDKDCRGLSDTSFIVAQESIFQLMEDDSFRRFCRHRSARKT